MSPDSIITLVVLVVAIVLMVSELLPVGLVALLAPLLLVLTDVLQAREMWAGLSHPAVVAVAAMFVVSKGLDRTGALGFLGNGLASIAQHGQRYLLFVMMIAVAVMSAFTNNTTVVLVCLPVVLSMCERMNHPPSRYLIPLSFASIFGGTMTLVGTSTNIVVAEVGRDSVAAAYGSEPAFIIGMWDFAPVGAVFLIAGIVYLVIFGPRLLPDRVALSMALSRGTPTEYFTEADILEGSSLVGKPLSEVAKKYDVRVLQLIRNDVIELSTPSNTLRAGDTLVLKGKPRQIVDFSDGTGAALLLDTGGEEMKTRSVDMTLAEVIVPPSSRWIGRQVSEIGFRSRYGVAVIALQRHGHHVRQKVGELVVEPADMLLVQGTVESLRNLRASENLILIEGIDGQIPIRTRAPLALLITALFVILVATGLLDIATGAVAAAVAMVLVRCITVQQAFDSFDWNVLFMLAGFLALGKALDKVGLAADAAHGLIQLMADAPFWMVVGAIYLLTAFLSDLLSNTAIAALMVPIVVQASRLLEVRPEPLVMAVAFAASAAFLTPVGYQTNLLVFGPGGYRFRDFIRVGLPLRFVFVILACVAIPYFHKA